MTVAATASQARRQTGRDRAGLPQALRAEWAKLVSLRSTRWALLVALLGTFLGTFLATNGSLHQRREYYRAFDPTNTALAGLAVASLVVGILATLCMTGEYGSGTIRSSLTAVPRRGLFFGAKVIVFGTFALVVGFVLCFVSFFLGQAILSAGRAPTASLADPGVLHVLVLSSLFLALVALFGLGLGAIIRHTAGALAAFVGCTLLVAALLQRVPGDPAKYTPVQIYANSVGAVDHVNGALSSTTGFLLMALYAAVALLIGAALLVARDA